MASTSDRTGPGSPNGGTHGSLARHARLLAQVADGAVVCVTSDGEVGFASEAAHDLLGGEAGFDRAWAWAWQRIRDGMGRSLEAARHRESGVNVALDMPADAGGRQLFVTMFPMDEDDECAGHLAVLKDRRSLEALQADLRLALQAKSHARTLDQAAHDLKAPLNALTVNVENLRHDLDDAGALPEVEDRVELLGSEIRRLNRMIQVAMSQFRLPSEVVRRFDLRRLVRQVVALMRPGAERRGVRIEARLPDERLPVAAVRDALQQALVNLVNNALEASSDGQRVALALTRQDGLVELRIRDEGEGIPPEAMKQLFKLHFTTKPSGSGLGLFTARAAVQRMGGHLTLESSPGEGATAVVQLPVAGFDTDAEVACSES